MVGPNSLDALCSRGLNNPALFFTENIRFPINYPTGCLLGCVTVVDVLSAEEYNKQYPEGESDSPYIFICEDCYELPIKFPMQGKHKICEFSFLSVKMITNYLDKLLTISISSNIFYR